MKEGIKSVDGDVFPQNFLGAYAGLFQSYAEPLYPVLILSDRSPVFGLRLSSGRKLRVSQWIDALHFPWGENKRCYNDWL
jgi:hypothetical protein